jgi:putative ABC transport system permease protein
MLLRVIQRRRELAVRVALGATRTRVLQYLLAENALLAVGSALVAVGVALAGSRILRTLLLSDDAPSNFVSIPRLFLFTMLVASGAGLLASLLPITAMRPDGDAVSLRVGAPAAGTTKSPLRTALLIGQIALTLALLVGGGLFTKSLRNVRAADLGFDRDGLLTVNIDFAGVAARPSAIPRDNEFYDGLVAIVGAVPGVTSVAVTSSVPFQYLAGSPLSIPGRDKATLPEQGAFSIIATEAYQRTIGLRLLAGRWFVPADYESGGESAVVVNETLARGFWPGEPAVGQCLVVGTGTGSQPCRTVVGVVADTRRSASGRRTGRRST